MQINTPIFLNKESTKRILNEVINLIPDNTEVYLFAGTVRNAILFKLLNKEVTQRDFDCIVIGDGEKFADNLVKAGFVFGSKNSDKAKILKKPRINDPIHQYDDWFYLDCKIFSSENNIENILGKITDFTLSGVALNIKDINSDNWIDNVVALPNALEDIKSRTMRIVIHYPLNIYKIIRLLSQGFTLVKGTNIQDGINKTTEVSKERLQKEIDKTINYVGGVENAQKIIHSLDITKDLLKID